MTTELNIKFAKIIIIKNDLAEIIVKPHVEISLDMVHQLHQTLRDNLTAPFFLLINKINTYSYDFEAMHELGTIKEIAGAAIICYSDKSESNSQYLSTLNRKKEWNTQIFKNRNDGLKWINQQKDNIISE